MTCRRESRYHSPVSIPVLALIGWLGGLGFALNVSESAPETHRTVLAVAGLFGGVTLAPIGLILFALAPDWALMYSIHPQHVPIFVLVGVIAIVLLGASVGGSAFALSWPRFALGVSVASGVMLVAVLGWGWRRLSTVGFYESIHYGVGETHLLARSALFVPAVVSAAALVGVYVFAFLHLRKQLR